MKRATDRIRHSHVAVAVMAIGDGDISGSGLRWGADLESVRNRKNARVRFRALLAEGASEMEVVLV
jgi:hypothetical protein